MKVSRGDILHVPLSSMPCVEYLAVSEQIVVRVNGTGDRFSSSGDSSHFTLTTFENNVWCAHVASECNEWRGKYITGGDSKAKRPMSYQP